MAIFVFVTCCLHATCQVSRVVIVEFFPFFIILLEFWSCGFCLFLNAWSIWWSYCFFEFFLVSYLHAKFQKEKIIKEGWGLGFCILVSGSMFLTMLKGPKSLPTLLFLGFLFDYFGSRINAAVPKDKSDSYTCEAL